MATPSAQSLVIPDDVVANFQALSPEQRQQIFDFAEFLVHQQKKAGEAQVAQPKRIRDLDKGAVIWISDDFDEPLPDDFWFGETDPLMMTDEQVQQLRKS